MTSTEIRYRTELQARIDRVEGRGVVFPTPAQSELRRQQAEELREELVAAGGSARNEGSFLAAIEGWPMWLQVPTMILAGLAVLVVAIVFLPLTALWLFFRTT